MKKTLKVVGRILVLLLMALLAWGLFEPYTLDQTEYIVELPDLPLALAGQTIAVIGDLQLGLWLDNDQTVEHAVEAIIETRPMLALITGDFVYHVTGPDDGKMEEVVALVRPLVAAGIPTFAVLGNHDYGMPSPKDPKRDDLADAVEMALEATGITVLRNESIAYQHPETGGELYIVGIDSHYAGNDNLAMAFAGTPSDAPRIVLMHNPKTFPNITPNSAPLALAGHTHGGQIRIPFMPDWSFISILIEDEFHADGWVVESFGAPGNRLYINRGIGMSVVPIRLLTPLELTFFILAQQSLQDQNQ